MKTIHRFVEQVTTNAGRILLKSSAHITQKKAGEGNWVTEADLASEKYIIKSILDAYSLHTILSEEKAPTIKRPESIPHLWIIDPLDGTTNYTYGIPLFCVSVAYMEYGKVMAGAVYDPVRNELYSAYRGHGCYLNGNKISIRDQASLKNAQVITSSPYAHNNYLRVNRRTIRAHKNGSRINLVNTAVLGSAWIAAGRGSLYYEYGLKPWDVAAASLLVEEAGGVARTIEKRGLNIFAFSSYIVGGRKIVRAFLRDTQS